MGDFIQNSAVKTSVRTLASPIEDVATFANIVSTVVSTNPFACASYISAGVTHAPVEKTREAYTVRIVFQDTDAKIVGTSTDRFDTVAGFNAGASALLTNTALATAHRGSPARDSDAETYSATIKCHDPNGEIYLVTFTRDRVTVTSYEDDAILAKVETWADTVPELA